MPGGRELRRIPVSRQTLGDAEIVSFAVVVDRTFVPSLVLAGSVDGRELGVRVFLAYLTAQDGTLEPPGYDQPDPD